MKTEPETFGLDDLKRTPRRTTCWDGVRNYQARNLLRDDVRLGDGVLFYHSSTREPAVVAEAEISRAAYPDPSQFHAESDYFDPRSSPDDPRWYAVDVRLVEEFRRPVTLAEMRGLPALEGMVLLRRGSRLSVQPVRAEHWRTIVRLGRGASAGRSPTTVSGGLR